MSAKPVPNPTLGVQGLIDKIRFDAIKASQEESDRILREAKEEAAATRASAKAEAAEMIGKAHSQIEVEKASGVAALKNAARDAMLELRSNVRAAFEEHVRHLVSQQMQQTEFIRNLVLVLACDTAEHFVKDTDAEIFISTSLGEKASGDKTLWGNIDKTILGMAGDMLRKGISLSPDEKIKAGARVRLVGQDLEIDLTDEAISQLC